MAGVNVIVEGTTIGTMTDSNGNFTLNVPSTSIKIKFSYIGYEDQIVLIKNNRNLNITLNENSEMLDEVQIIGYGTQKKITVTGAVSSVGTKDILKSPVPNVAQALTGKVPGLSTIQYSGQPGADPKRRAAGAAAHGLRQRHYPLRPCKQLWPTAWKCGGKFWENPERGIFCIQR